VFAEIGDQEVLVRVEKGVVDGGSA
jgi:hypothetical protein